MNQYDEYRYWLDRAKEADRAEEGQRIYEHLYGSDDDEREELRSEVVALIQGRNRR